MGSLLVNGAAARIAINDIRRALVTPGFWVLIALMQAGLAWLFFVHLDRFVNLQPKVADNPGAPGLMDLVVGPVLMDMVVLLLLATPLLALRSLSDERRTGSLVLLQSAPVSDGQILLGKFSGLTTLLLIPLLPALAMILTLEMGSHLDGVRLLTGVLGVVLTLKLAAAVGLFASAGTRHPPLAAALTYGILLLLWLLDISASPANAEPNLVRWLAIPAHLERLLEARLRPADLLYFSIAIGGFLLMTLAMLAHLRGGFRAISLVLKGLGILTVTIAALWVAAGWRLEWPLSASGRHSLSPVTEDLLSRLESTVELTAYVKEADRRSVADFIDAYVSRTDKIQSRYVDLDSLAGEDRDVIRQWGIPASGGLVVAYQGGTEVLLNLGESELISALQRLMLRGERWVVSLQGHGERRLDGDANYDLRDFAKALERSGFHLHQLDLTQSEGLPGNTGVLLLADPRAPLSMRERVMIADHIAGGGNLLWLADPKDSVKPGDEDASRWLEDLLPVSRMPGVVVDAKGATIGLDDPRHLTISRYGAHKVTDHLDSIALLPGAGALSLRATAKEWQSSLLMASSDQSWNEIGAVKGEVRQDSAAGETRGPLPVGIALSREVDDGEQRIVIIGDSDFLSNAWLGNGANLDLGLAMIRWLTANDELVDLGTTSVPDARLEMSRTTLGWIAGTFLFGIPALLIAIGVIIAWRRR